MSMRGDPLWQERQSRLRARPTRHRNLTGNKDLEAAGKADHPEWPKRKSAMQRTGSKRYPRGWSTKQEK
jgi:hypothetical protein